MITHVRWKAKKYRRAALEVTNTNPSAISNNKLRRNWIKFFIFKDEQYKIISNVTLSISEKIKYHKN